MVVGLVVGLEGLGFELVDLERGFVLEDVAGLEDDDLFAPSLSLGFFVLLVGFSGCV